ncbi:MAG TPA: acyltransferase [Polyangia bacterium]|nr:acyltransferase [Polyangia bacterium]
MKPEGDIRKYDYLDACRGYAILLVMIAHSYQAFPNLPWHVMRLTNLGFKGVQLFFVVSSLTLAMSWRRRSRIDERPFAAFMVRRFFRIAPAFVVAFFFYLVVFPPGARFNWTEALTTLTFTNGWSPATMATVPGAWQAIDGSWSVAVEFGFYLLFPLFALGLTTLGRALGAFAALLALAYVLDGLGFGFYSARYGAAAADQFIFYWLPNQLPVFCLGFVALFLPERLGKRDLGRTGTVLCALLVCAFAALSYIPFQRTPQLTPPFLPLHVVAALFFCAFVTVLGLSPGNPFTNRPMIALGKVSFSAYLLHWTFIALGAHLFDVGASGLEAIGAATALAALVIVLTYIAASLTYRRLEQPMIAVGHRLAEKTNG